MNEQIGTFRGTVLRQEKGKVGGARSVFANFNGIKNELIYPYNGGTIKNAPKGTGFKFFTGDLMEYRTNDKYAKPEVYLLKTYLVESVSGSTVNVVRDGYKHTPFVGDSLGVAPEEIGGAVTAVTVTSVAKAKVGEVDVWALTISGTLDASKGDVLVEADAPATDDVKEALRNVAMQIAALNPKYLSSDDVPEEYKEHEKEILIAQLKNDPKNASKPDEIIEKMISGRLAKELKEVCLLEQLYVKAENKESVAKYLEMVSNKVGSTIAVKSFVRYETGEGLEKKEDDFAAEVAAMAGQN